MKLMRYFILTFFLLLPVWASEAGHETRTATSNTDGIEIAASLIIDNEGNRSVACTLINHTKHILASAYPNSRSMCFQFTLLGADGKAIPMGKQWAMTHAQPFSIRPDNTSWLAAHIRPQEERKFQFNLKDAYAERASEGKEIIVKWISVYSNPGTMVHVDEMRLPDGKIMPAYQEKNHFSGRREFVVKLPLTDDKPNGFVEPQDNTSEQTESVSTDNPAIQTQTEDRKPPTSESFDLRWLFLLLIPVFVLLLRFFRSRKAS